MVFLYQIYELLTYVNNYDDLNNIYECLFNRLRKILNDNMRNNSDLEYFKNEFNIYSQILKNINFNTDINISFENSTIEYIQIIITSLIDEYKKIKEEAFIFAMNNLANSFRFL